MTIYNKSNPLRVFTAFSGYDSQCLALERLKSSAPPSSTTSWWKMSYANLIRDDGRKTTFIMKIEG